MESNMNHVCVDFFGIPGCGKSTIAHLLAQKLADDDTVEEPSYNLAHQKGNGLRAISKIFSCIALLFCHPGISFRLIGIIRQCGYHFFSSSFHIHVYNLAYKIKKMCDLRCKYILFDEGLWQSAVSLYYNRPCTSADVINLHSKLFELASTGDNNVMNYVSVFVDTDVNEAIHRQKSRAARPSRVQSLEETAKEKELNKQKNIFASLNADIVVNSTNVMPNENAVLLYKQIV